MAHVGKFVHVGTAVPLSIQARVGAFFIDI